MITQTALLASRALSTVHGALVTLVTLSASMPPCVLLPTPLYLVFQPQFTMTVRYKIFFLISSADPCPNGCSGHGSCDDGKCHCDIGWNGNDCGSFDSVTVGSAIGGAAIGYIFVCACSNVVD